MDNKELKILKNQLQKKREDQDKKLLEKMKRVGFVQDPYQEAFDRQTAAGYEIMEKNK